MRNVWRHELARYATGIARRFFGLRLFVCLARELHEAHVHSGETRRRDSGALVETVELSTAAQLTSLWSDPALDVTRAFVEDALQRHHRVVAVMLDGAIAGYCWLSVTTTPIIDDLLMELPPGSCYIYKAFTAPRYRGMGLLGLCLQHASRVAASELHAERLITLVERGNLNSLRAFGHWGFKRFGYVWFSSRLRHTIRSRGSRDQRLVLSFETQRQH